MNHAVAKILAATALAAGLVAGVAGSAFATSSTVPPSKQAALDALKAKCDAAITERLNSIGVVTARISSAKHLGTDQAALLAIFNDPSTGAIGGLNALKTKIDDPNGDPNLKADCDSIFTNFRIYALRIPQVRLVVAADDETAAIARLTTAATNLQNLIDKVKDTSRDLDGAKAALADMNAKLADATKQVNGVNTAVIKFSPSDWNKKHDVLAPYVTDVKAVRADLVAAVADARTVVKDLRK